MKTLKARHPRLWCIIVVPIVLISIAIAWPIEYTMHFSHNLKRILSNLWNDLSGLFSCPFRQTRRSIPSPPWRDIKKTWCSKPS